MTVIDSVDKPRSPLTESEKEDCPLDGNPTKLAMTRSGNTYLTGFGSKWKIININGQSVGKGFQEIDEYMTLKGVQLYVGENGSQIYILDDNGNPLSEGHSSIKHMSGTKFKGNRKKFTIQLEDHKNHTSNESEVRSGLDEPPYETPDVPPYDPPYDPSSYPQK